MTKTKSKPNIEFHQKILSTTLIHMKYKCNVHVMSGYVNYTP